MELKNKITNLDNNNLNIKNDVDVLEALKTLGYSNKEAVDALKKVPGTITDVGDKIKEAIKYLGK